MPKDKYMALADFQSIWTNSIKPAIPSIAVTYASVSEATAAAAELT